MSQGENVTVHGGNFTSVGGDYHEHRNTTYVVKEPTTVSNHLKIFKGQPVSSYELHVSLLSHVKILLKPNSRGFSLPQKKNNDSGCPSNQSMYALLIYCDNYVHPIL